MTEGASSELILIYLTALAPRNLQLATRAAAALPSLVSIHRNLIVVQNQRSKEFPGSGRLFVFCAESASFPRELTPLPVHNYTAHKDATFA